MTDRLQGMRDVAIYRVCRMCDLQGMRDAVIYRVCDPGKQDGRTGVKITGCLQGMS